jgi:hypothetical protein
MEITYTNMSTHKWGDSIDKVVQVIWHVVCVSIYIYIYIYIYI